MTEARAASQLNHPNSVSVFDFGRTDDDQPYLVMEFLRGKDLARIAYEEGPLPFPRIVDVLRQVLAALSEAHDLGIVHRDLLLAAETGHLVLSTLHTLDATETINRIITVFPPHQQRQVRIQLASVLKAAVSQRLLPRADGGGRTAAVEVMVSTAFIRDAIVDKDKTSLIHGAIAAGTSQYGMQTFDQSIFSLYQQGLVTLEEALRWASNVDEFKLKVQGISSTADMARDQMLKKPAPAPGGPPEITRFGG
jgi:twitching motility protein PilT